MPLGITELLARIGDDNVRLQNLFEGDVDLTVTKRGTRISFYTDPANVTPTAALKGQEKIALVLWLPRALVTKAQADHRAGVPVAAPEGG